MPATPRQGQGAVPPHTSRLAPWASASARGRAHNPRDAKNPPTRRQEGSRCAGRWLGDA